MAEGYDYTDPIGMKQRSDAVELLRRHGIDAASVWRVYGAGDSDVVRAGRARETILYRAPDGAPKTAILFGGGCSVDIRVEDGW